MLGASGIRAIDADQVGHEVLGREAFDQVARKWPAVVEEGLVDRAALAAIVFSDLDQLQELEAITHPLIFGKILSDLDGFEGVAVVEMPLMLRPDGWSRLVVDAPDHFRFERAVGRGMDPLDVSRRMASQPTRAEWLASADLVVPNAASLDELQSTVGLLAEHLTR